MLTGFLVWLVWALLYLTAIFAATAVTMHARALLDLPQSARAETVAFYLAQALVAAGLACAGLVLHRSAAVVTGALLTPIWIAVAFHSGMRVRRIPPSAYAERPQWARPWVQACSLDPACRRFGHPERLTIHPLRLYVDFEGDRTGCVMPYRIH